MEKPAAIDLLYKRLLGSELAYDLFRFNLLAFLYASKMDKRVMHRTAGLGASFFQYYEKEKYTEDVTDRFEILQKLDDKQIEQYADNMIEYVRDQGHLATLLGLGIFTGGLFSL